MTAPFFCQGMTMKYYRIFSIVLLVSLVACNILLRIPATPVVDERLVPYVRRFKELCQIYNTDCSKIDKFSIKLTDMSAFDLFYKMLGQKGKVIGHCYRESNEITIRKDYFQESLAIENEQLMIHELGHCVLDLEHTEKELAVMNPYALYHTFYRKNYNELMNKFFNCENFCPVVTFDQSKY